MAIKFYLFLNGIAFLLSGFVSLEAFLTVFITAILLYFYSYKLKGVPFIGNLLVAFLTGFVFIYAGIVVGNIVGGFIPFIFAFEINLIRELTKDIEDYEGDSANMLKTLPIVKGIGFSKKIISFLIVLLIVTSPIPYFYFQYNYLFLFMILFIIDFPLVNILLKINSTIPDYHKISKYLKTLMILGLIILIIGAA